MTDSRSPRASTDVVALLGRAAAGDRGALEGLLPLLYDELRATARRTLAREREGHTLQATDLVHEAWFKLAGAAPVQWQDKAHFLAVAARAMRQVLVDHARRRRAGKRGGDALHVTLGNAGAEESLPPEELLALDDALNRLDAMEPRLRAVVEYRFFGGLSEREIAEVLGVTERTVQRDWAKARAWLHKEIYPAEGPPR